MTTTDFSVEFDLLYNNALSNSAPEINPYEKSLFLTQAQEEIIKEAYDDKKKGTSFESSEAIRRRLEELAVTQVAVYQPTLNSALNDIKMSVNSKFFEIENNVWYLLYERCNTTTKQLYIVPTALDQFSMLEDNPFKMPNRDRAWRLDVKNTINDIKVVEIISTQPLASYFYRYLKEPTPIVLTDLDVLFPGMDLTINGVSAETGCILNSEVHRIILKRAVELATAAYKENSLSNNIQLNNRNN